ncbi:hypothetical protein ACUY4R_000350 [Kosakonia sp. BK9b]
MKRFPVAAGAMVLMAGLSCAHAAPPEPELLFNCDLTNGKSVTVRVDNGVPAYSYGSIEKLEMALPKITGDKTQVRAGKTAFSGGGASWYRFINGRYSYVVYSGIGKGWEFTGLKVYQGQKLIMKKSCQQGGFLSNPYQGENLVNDADTGDDGTYGYAE